MDCVDAVVQPSSLTISTAIQRYYHLIIRRVTEAVRYSEFSFICRALRSLAEIAAIERFVLVDNARVITATMEAAIFSEVLRRPFC